MIPTFPHIYMVFVRSSACLFRLLEIFCEFIIILRTGNVERAIHTKYDTDTYLQLLEDGPQGGTSYNIGKACICFECGHIGLPSNIEACNRNKKLNGSCNSCSGSEQTNFVSLAKPDGSNLPWKEVNNGTNVSESAALGKAPSRNSPCSCGSGKKWKKCCGKNK